jgi:hypothetical protein
VKSSHNKAFSVARGLRRPSLTQSDHAAEQCIEALEKSPYATLKDHQLIAWAKLESIMKDVAQLLGLNESGTVADISDLLAQRTIEVFQKRLERWEKELCPGIMFRMYLEQWSSQNPSNLDQLHWKSFTIIARCTSTKLLFTTGTRTISALLFG